MELLLFIYFLDLTRSLVLIYLILVYLYLTRNHNYWRNLGVPGTRPLPFFGTYLCQFFKPFQDTEVERYQKFGKIYGIYDGTLPGLIVGEPGLIKQIMVGTNALDIFPNRRAVKTSHPVMSKFLSSLENDEWKRVRSITTPTFSSGKLLRLLPIMNVSIVELLSELDAAATQGSEVDLKSLFGDYTMRVIARSAFATEPDPTFVRQASTLFTFPFWRKFIDYVVPKSWLDSALVKFTVLPPEPMDFFRKVTISAIQRRRNGLEAPQNDFLQLLIDAQGESGNGSHLSEEEILAQSVLFFSVGFETSSQQLMYAAYCLALNPEVQEKLFTEIQEAVGEGEVGRDILGLPYLNAVTDESLRLYNPVLRMERKASSDFPLGDTGLVISKGMILGIPVWALHHSEEYFPEPWAFKPERFLPGNKDAITPFTYLPFGEGPRSCIGSRFALMESKLALAKIILKFRFVESPSTKIPLEFFPTGRPLLGPKSIYIGVERRI